MSECEIKDVDLAAQKKEVSFLVEKNSKPYELTLHEAIVKQLNYLCVLAKNSLGVKECDAVFAVPRSFTQEQTDFLKNCGENAGFKVHRVITNPMASCLAYNLDEEQTAESKVLVYRMGGNSIEVTLVSIVNGLYRCVDSICVKSVGGDRFTDVVVNLLAEEFIRKHKSDPKVNKRSFTKLKSNAQEVKHVLSTMERAHSSIECLSDGIDFDYYLTRQRFEGACMKIYEEILQPIDDLLKANSITESEIKQVILAGGATSMCKLQSLVKQKFPNAKQLNTQSTDEVIALGCAKQSSIITNRSLKNRVTNDDLKFQCLSKSLFVKIGDQEEKKLILQSRAPFPIKNTFDLEFDLNKPYLTIIEESDEKVLAKINLDKFKSNELSLLAQIKLNGSIEITVTETSTSQKITMFLNNSESTKES
jgi:molecular chaperone DnaK (HSP70)